MLEFLQFTVMVDLGYALAALLGLFLGLRWLDKRNGRPWAQTMDIIRSDALAAAVYYAARWAGACLVVAAFLSR